MKESSPFVWNYGEFGVIYYLQLEESNDTASSYISKIRNSVEKKYYQLLEFDYSTNYYELALAEYMLSNSFVKTQADTLNDYITLNTMSIAGNLLSVARNKNILIEDEETFIDSVISVIDGSGLENSAAYKYTANILSQIMDNDEGFTAENIASVIYNGGAHLSDLAELAENAKNIIDLFANASNLCAALDAFEDMNEDFKTVFRYASTQTSNTKIRNAFNYYSDSYRETWQKKLLSYTKAGIKAADIATFNVVSEIVVDFTKNQVKRILLSKGIDLASSAASNVISGVVVGAKIGTAVSKLIFNIADLNEDISMAIAYFDISECFRKSYKKFDSDFEKNKSYANACLTVCAMQSNSELLMLCSNELLGFYNQKQEHIFTAVKNYCQEKLGKSFSFEQQLAEIQHIRDSAYRVNNVLKSFNDLKSQISNEDIVKRGTKALKVACPVNVYIYDNSGNLLCYTNGTKAYNNSYSVACCVVGEEKYIALPDTDDYKVKIIGTDNGTMDVSVSMLNANNSVTDEVSYNDIPVFLSEQYNTEIEESFFESPEKQSISSSKSDYHPSEIKSYVKITGIEIVSNPEKTNYTYKSVSSPDLSGMIIKAIYSDGSSEIIDDVSNVKVKEFSSSKPAGSKVATVEYKGCKAQFNYSVSYTWWQMIIRILLLGFIWY